MRIATATAQASPASLRDAAAILAVHAYYTTLRSGSGLPASRLMDRDSFQLAEQFLESAFYEDLRPRLGALYRSPFGDDGGLKDAYQRNRLRSFLRSHYRNNPAAALGMRDALDDNKRRAFDLGGQYALDYLGLPGRFRLEEPRIIDRLREESTGATTVDGEMSLVDTTVEELTKELERQRQSGAELTDAIPIINAWLLGRTIIRTALIVQTESVRSSRWAMLSAFIGNGISSVTFYTVGDERVCNLCRPLHGERFDVRSVFYPMRDVPAYATIPVHPRCRCFYDAVMDGWRRPALIWTGFALAGILND